jgi:hypothetical protein
MSDHTDFGRRLDVTFTSRLSVLDNWIYGLTFVENYGKREFRQTCNMTMTDRWKRLC